MDQVQSGRIYKRFVCAFQLLRRGLYMSGKPNSLFLSKLLLCLPRIYICFDPWITKLQEPTSLTWGVHEKSSPPPCSSNRSHVKALHQKSRSIKILELYLVSLLSFRCWVCCFNSLSFFHFQPAIMSFITHRMRSFYNDKKQQVVLFSSTAIAVCVRFNWSRLNP